MKHLKRLFMLVVVFFVMIVTTACSNKGADGIDCELKLTARRDKITVVAEFFDSKERIFNGITPSVAIYKYENNKIGEQINSKSLSIKSGESVKANTTSDEVVFSGLDVDKQYTVKVMVTVDGYESTLKEQTVSTTLEGSDSEHPILINTIEDFDNIKYDREGFFKLNADIDFGGKSISPMHYLTSSSFSGEIDGNNHSIKNFKLDTNQQYAGLVGFNTGTIKNLTIDGMELKATKGSEAHIGLICGMNEGSIINCKVLNSKVTATSSTYSAMNKFNVGGICGTLSGDKQGVEIKDCTVSNINITANLVNSGSIGGVIGHVLSPVQLLYSQVVENVNVDGQITVNQQLKTNSNKDVEIYVGGFIGEASGNIKNSSAKVDINVTTKSVDSFYSTIKENTKNDILEFNVYVGGFAGRDIPNRFTFIENVSYEGSIVVSNDLKYKEDKDTVKHLTFNLYTGGLFGKCNFSRIKNSSANVSKLEVTSVKEFINGEHNIFAGVLFGKDVLTAEDLTKKNITFNSNVKEQVNANDFKVNLNDNK